MSESGPLKGIQVIELAQGVAGPMAACRLADLGATVTKIEFDEGDWTRNCAPFLKDGMSNVFFSLNRGKKSVWLKSCDSNAQKALKELILQADVFVTDMNTQQCRDKGIDGVDSTMCAWHPKLVVAQLSAYGKNGPLSNRAGSELTSQAMAGYTRYVGQGSEASIRLGADVAGCSTAIFTVQAILAALLERNKSHQGQRIDLSLLNSLLSMKTVHLAAQSDPDTYEGPRVGGAYDPPERGWATKDKPITFAFGGAVGAEGRAGWTDFVKDLNMSHMLDDPRYDKNGRLTTGLGPMARTLKSDYEKGFKKHPSEYVVAKVREHGGFASAYLNHSELMNEPQIKAMNIIQKVKTGSTFVDVLTFPAKFSNISVQIKGEIEP